MNVLGATASTSTPHPILGIPAIAGISVAAVVLLGLVSFFVFTTRSRRRRKRNAMVFSTTTNTTRTELSSSSSSMDMIANPVMGNGVQLPRTVAQSKSPLSGVAPTRTILSDDLFSVETDGIYNWYVNTMTGESCWTLPAGGKIQGP